MSANPPAAFNNRRNAHALYARRWRSGALLKMADSKLVDIAAQLRHETPAAFLIFDGTKQEWVPKSQVEDNKDGTFTMPEWLAQAKGFI